METKEIQKEIRNGAITDAHIQQWKQKYGKVMEVRVEDENTIYTGYFHRPNMETMSAVNKLAKTDEIKGSMIMFDNCWLGGDEMMKTDAVIKISALTQLSTIFMSCSASLKNL